MKNNRSLFVSNPGPGQSRRIVPSKSSKAMQPTSKVQPMLSGKVTQQIVNQLQPVITGTIAKHLGPKAAMAYAAAPEAYHMLRDAGIKMPKVPIMSLMDSLKPGTPVFKLKGSDASKASVMNSSYGLSKAPEPKAVILNSGIVPNTYSNDYMVGTQNLCSPMHISCVSLAIPTASTNSLSNYFTQTICFDIQTRAQANVGFDLNIAAQISSPQLLAAFNSAINALQVYYWYSSILAYEADPRNKNEGMINLRQNISAQIISDLNQLKRRLEDTPIPPKLMSWVKYMSANYYSGMSPGSPIIKTCFNADAIKTPTANYAAAALLSLNSPANTTVFALLRRSIPQWRVGKLYDVTISPNFDRNFKTIFCNLPSAYLNATPTLVNSNPVTGSSISISYNTYHNRLDGVAYAMGGVYNTTATQWEPGLVTPITGGATAGLDSRLSWASNGTTSSWTSATNSAFLALSRDESYATFGGASYTPHLVGAEKCQQVTGTTLTQTAQNTLDFLFDVDAIPRQGQLNSFSHIMPTNY